jgi:hypothetical protein
MDKLVEWLGARYYHALQFGPMNANDKWCFVPKDQLEFLFRQGMPGSRFTTYLSACQRLAHEKLESLAVGKDVDPRMHARLEFIEQLDYTQSAGESFSLITAGLAPPTTQQKSCLELEGCHGTENMPVEFRISSFAYATLNTGVCFLIASGQKLKFRWVETTDFVIRPILRLPNPGVLHDALRKNVSVCVLAPQEIIQLMLEYASRLTPQPKNRHIKDQLEVLEAPEMEKLG